MSKELLEIKDLHVNAGEKEILKGLNLKINKGEVHVIMWPNMSNGIETNIIPTTIMWDCSTVEVWENYMSAVI